MITSAQFANDTNTAVIVVTTDRGQVLLQLTGTDTSGGLRSQYLAWAEDNQTAAYNGGGGGGSGGGGGVGPPNPMELANSYVASRLSAPQLHAIQSWSLDYNAVDIPKTIAVRNWVGSVFLSAEADDLNFDELPYTFAEVVEEVFAL